MSTDQTTVNVNLEGVKSCCVSGSLHSNVQPKVDCYVTGDESKKEKTILFITDIFGWQLPNARGLADAYAAAGFYVVVPDLFNGDPVPLEVLTAIAPLPSQAEAKTVADKAKDGVSLGRYLPPWLAKHTEATCKPLIVEALQALRSDPQIKKIGVVGFCWGGRYAMLLGQKDKSPSVDAIVANHPSNVQIPDDLLTINKPVLINIGKEDTMLPQDQLARVKEIFLKDLKDVPTHVENFEEGVHGFTIRADLTNEKEKKEQDHACATTVAWFHKYL